MSKETKIIVGFSIGDLNGIGCEVILKSLQDSQILDLCTPVIFGSAKVLTFTRRTIDSDIKFHGINSLDNIVPRRINVLNLWKEQPEIKFGQRDKKIGEYAVSSLEAATKALKENKIDVLVTAPIEKWNIQSKKFNFPGHTDYLAKELGGESLMLLVNEGLRVGLLTDHVPIQEVASHITPELIRYKVGLMNKSLLLDFGIRKPRIAVLGLNPHSGDHGVIGKEEEEIILPTLEEIRKEEAILVYGPYAADSFFGTNTHTQFDGILACYHDQGLVPFKTLSFGSGVNFTAGLNRVRTSPDHGTAYDIAGENKANPSSFLQAIFLAIDVYNQRKEYENLTKDPLETQKRNNLQKKIRKN